MKLRTDQVRPNPDQPRKRFDAAALAELAESIKQNGLLQPVTVRRAAADDYLIVAGERRWRAHQLAGLEFIDCNVHETMSDDALAINAIVENLQRQDITPLEEARAYRRMVDSGYTCETLAQRLGVKQPHRIADRLQLLRLREGYLQLLELGHLTPSQAFELSRLEPAHQPALFELIKSGRCETYNKLRAAADGLLAAVRQQSMFELPPAPTEAERAQLSRFETMVERLVSLCNEGIHENEIVVLRKVDPGRAGTMVTKLALIRADLARMEKALQQRAAQGALLAA
jgi:ParB family chromosome partitioning protein